MIVSRLMNATPDTLFSAITKSLIYDYSSSTGKELSESDIAPGLSYVKNLATKVKTSGDVKVEITRYETNVCYESKVISNQGINVTRYTLVPIEDKTEFTYEEEFISDSKVKKANFKIMDKIYSKNNKKRMEALLDAIEQSVVEKGEM